MATKRGPWFIVAVAATALNVLGGIYAYSLGELAHAFVHGAAAVGFGLLSRYLAHRATVKQQHIDKQVDVAMLETSLSELERELHETRQRLEFSDQLLRQRKDDEPK